jgi:uncharacterized protein YecE (DUF72 family)
MYGSESPLESVGKICYIRFHGTSGKYGGGYSAALLRKWADIIQGALKRGQEVYAYFNNDIDAHAPEDALRLREMLGG